MTEPFAQELKLWAPWGFIARVQSPEGWQFHEMLACHNTHNLLRVATDYRQPDRFAPGYSLQGAYVASGLVEIPIHLGGITTPR